MVSHPSTIITILFIVATYSSTTQIMVNGLRLRRTKRSKEINSCDEIKHEQECEESEGCEWLGYIGDDVTEEKYWCEGCFDDLPFCSKEHNTCEFIKQEDACINTEFPTYKIISNALLSPVKYFYSLPGFTPLMDTDMEGVVPPTQSQTSDCLQYWRDTFEDMGGFETDPSMIEKNLKLIGVYELDLVQDKMSEYLKHPVSVVSMIDSTVEGLSRMPAVVQMACEARDDPSLQLSAPSNTSANEIWKTALNLYVVLEILTVAMDECVELHIEFAKAMRSMRDDIINYYKRTREGDYLAFSIAKFGGLLEYTEWMSSKRMIGKQLTDNEANSFKKTYQINILEAGVFDAQQQLTDNSRLAYALAATASGLPDIKGTSFVWDIGYAHEDSYITWNMAFVTIISRSPWEAISKLFIPSIVAPSKKGDWIQRRSNSLAMLLVYYAQVHAQAEETDLAHRLSLTDTGLPRNSNLSRRWGQLNQQFVCIGEPQPGLMEDTICGMESLLLPECPEN